MDVVTSQEFEENVEKSLSKILGFQAKIINYSSFATTSRRLLSDAGVTYTVTGSSTMTSETVASQIDSKADTEFKALLNGLSGSSITNIISFSSATTSAPSIAPIAASAGSQPALRSGESPQQATPLLKHSMTYTRDMPIYYSMD